VSKPKLLASSPTREGVQALVTRYYGGTAHTVREDLVIVRDSDQYTPKGLRVVLSRDVYRFERVG
jgi:hypothetical protein